MIFQSLKQILLEEQIQETDEIDHPLGNNARYTVFPKTEEEMAAILNMANEKSFKVIPTGGGTKRGFGGLEEKADIILSLADYKGIVEHSAGDMTLIVRAGTPIKEITDYLATYKQMVSLDPSWPAQATIGGVIAANDSGPKRLCYGSARDIVLGMRVVYPDGRIIRSGGKTVKNVAGYDMNKLFIGSMGTLGVISMITLKLRPLPKYESLVLLTFPKGDLQEIRSFVIRMLDSAMEPISLEVLSPTLAKTMGAKNSYTLAIALEDREKSVHYQEQWIKDHLPKEVDIHVLAQEEAIKWWSAFATIAPHTPTLYKQNEGKFGKDVEIDVALKIGSRNLDVLELVDSCYQLGEKLQVNVYAHGGPGHGISRAYLRGNSEQLTSFVSEIRSLAERKGGYVVVQHAPFRLRDTLNVWGEKPSYFSLFEGVKRTFDPNRILNHKRFVGGL